VQTDMHNGNGVIAMERTRHALRNGPDEIGVDHDDDY
jgi:hypothetical protein